MGEEVQANVDRERGPNFAETCGCHKWMVPNVYLLFKCFEPVGE